MSKNKDKEFKETDNETEEHYFSLVRTFGFDSLCRKYGLDPKDVSMGLANGTTEVLLGFFMPDIQVSDNSTNMLFVNREEAVKKLAKKVKEYDKKL